MTRLELLTIVLGRARTNGFEFRRWYTTRLALPWISTEAAIACLDQQRRYYALLFSHEFAHAFWKPGEDITFQVASQTFQRVTHKGTVETVKRKSFTRRSARKDAWRYHLREMALAEDPLRYIRRYLNVEEDLTEPEPDAAPEAQAASATPAPTPKAASKPAPATRARIARAARPLPTDLPAFLRRPYP